MQALSSSPFPASLAAGPVSLQHSSAQAQACPPGVSLGVDLLTACVLVSTQVHSLVHKSSAQGPILSWTTPPSKLVYSLLCCIMRMQQSLWHCCCCACAGTSCRALCSLWPRCRM